MSERYPIKRICIYVEWRGACSERDWGCVLSRVIEETDHSRLSKATHFEELTQHGTTERVPDQRESRIAISEPVLEAEMHIGSLDHEVIEQHLDRQWKEEETFGEWQARAGRSNAKSIEERR